MVVRSVVETKKARSSDLGRRRGGVVYGVGRVKGPAGIISNLEVRLRNAGFVGRLQRLSCSSGTGEELPRI